MGDRDRDSPIVLVMRQYFVYVLASHSRRLYIGVTKDLFHRVAEHREGMDAFTHKYQITRLVHFETSGDGRFAPSG